MSNGLGSPIVVRPSVRAFLRATVPGRAAWLALAVVCIALFVVIAMFLSSVTLWTAAGIALAVGLTSSASGLVRERIGYGDGEYRFRDSLGRVRALAAMEVEEALFFESRFHTDEISRVALKPRDGTRPLRLRGDLWESTDLYLLAEDMQAKGIDTIIIRPEVDQRGVREQHPWAFSWPKRHPQVLTQIGVGVISAGVLIEKLIIR
ncbi:hypothetical protein ACFSBZ_15405 [Amnibacterium flavum]|uniref:Uncharacterized protein n=1 Tax=Amnibacterium flavum TaxID=2173173 RepID=A0A2V1HW87_9MICO|nr:hypothetical protein [Amnibacterium flavum]PVZ96102.1 hypothetical protein DDQ50_06595 [Amnibacterium flavum]